MGSEEEMLLRKMLLDMQRKMASKAAARPEEAKVDYARLFTDSLTEDGREMYRMALEQYPEAARKVAEAVGQLIAAGKVRGPLDAESVFMIFEQLGYPIRIETKIVYKKKGRVKTISEVLKEE